MTKGVRLGAAVASIIFVCSGVAAASIAAVTKDSLPAGTSSAVTTLIGKEQAVVRELHAFAHLGNSANVATWESALKSAQGAQAAAAAKLSADLAAVKSKPGSGASQSGSTESFKDESGNPYTVTAVGYYDPAQPANQFESPSAGTRLFAAEFRITDTGANAISDDADNDASVVGSNDQSYQPSFDDVSECTNFNDGEYQLQHGQSVTGCVVFEVPSSIKITRVEWSPDGGFGGSFGEWKV